MAVFKIVRLNKMTCGNRRGLIDMDIHISPLVFDVCLLPGTNVSSLPGYPAYQTDAGIITESNTDYEYARTDAIYDYPSKNSKKAMQMDNTDNLVLNEDQQAIDISTYDNSLSTSDAIQLTPLSWLSSNIDFEVIYKMNVEMSCVRVVYEFELDLNANHKALLNTDDSSTSYVIPMNDLLDLCVKSMFKKVQANYSIPGNLLLDNYQMTYSKNVDQYFVFDEAPVDICQFGGDAFTISQSMTKQPYRMQSNLRQQLFNSTFSSTHTFSLVNDDIQTVLYPGVSQYSASTYQEYLKKDASRYAAEEGLIDVFTPRMNITGMNYNYIVQIEQNTNLDKRNDNRTIYDNGDIYGFFTTCKNMYNALYSMEMSNATTMKHCREYIGVQNAGRKLVLKFYDNCNYSIVSNNLSDAQAVLSKSNDSQVTYPYQKIESFAPNRFSYATYHKSNLFSIKIRNSGLDGKSLKNCTSEQINIANSIKKSIQNAMKQLVDSIAPANTQLFDTYFISDED